MSFLSAGFLWALPLLAVPVAIHLLSRRQQDVVKWGAMQFLQDSRIRRRKMWRLDDLILMLLRTLAVVAIVLALTRPLWHWAGLGNPSGRDVIFVWDVSLSMSRQLDEQQTSFDRLFDKASELMNQLNTGDTVRAMVTIGRGRWLSSDPLPATAAQRQRLLEELKTLGATQSSADWYACLSSALRSKPPKTSKARLIVAISDAQAYGWQQQDQMALSNLERLMEASSLPTTIELYNAIGTVPGVYNLAVDKLTTSRPLLGVNETFVVEAEVRNHGHTSITSATVDWLLDDVSIGKSTVGPFPPGQSRLISIKHSTTKPGIRRLQCKLDLHDYLDGDNEQTLILETIDQVPLLLVDDSAESDPLKSDKGYLLAALGQDRYGENPKSGSSAFRVTTVTPAELGSTSLADFRAIIFANLPSVDDETVARLTEFARSGGGLWIALGDKADLREFNEKFYRAGSGLSPLSIEPAVGDLIRREDFVTIHPPERDHPATLLLADTDRLDIDKVKIFRRYEFAPAPGSHQVPVLLQAGNGEVLAIEGFLGHGRIIVQAMPVGIRWSNFPLTQSYVPMVHEWLWYLIQPTGISHNLTAGETLQVPLPTNEHIREVDLISPTASIVTLPIQRRGEQSIARSRDTYAPGRYQAIVHVEGKDDMVIPYQVARQPEESNLDQWSPELATAWSSKPGFRLDPQVVLALPTNSAKARPGQPIWQRLLAIVVLAILVEVWLAGRIAKRKFGSSSISTYPAAPITRAPEQTVGVRGNA